MKLFKTTWENCKSEIEKSNSTLFKLLNKIIAEANVLTPNFFYKACYSFGEKIISNGDMSLFDKKTLKESTVICPFSDLDQHLLKEEFFKLIEITSGHPLALVVKNYIEIFKIQLSTYKDTKTYSYPLSTIQYGQLFGVWENIDLMFGHLSNEERIWSAVAGKECLWTTLPIPHTGKAKGHYIKLFEDVFESDYVSGFQKIANSILRENNEEFFTETIIIPAYFFILQDGDTTLLIQLKMALREFIFKTGWNQAKAAYQAVNEKELMDVFKVSADDASFALPLLKHIIKIAYGENFLLRPISDHDGILYQTLLRIIQRFFERTYKDHTDGIVKNFLSYNTPLFFHYNKLGPLSTWGFEMMHSPAYNVLLPQYKLDKVKTTIDTVFLSKQHNITNYLESKNMYFDFEFFVHNTDKSARRSPIKDFLEKKELQESFGDMLPSGCTIKAPSKYPWFFNAILLIRKLS